MPHPPSSQTPPPRQLPPGLIVGSTFALVAVALVAVNLRPGASSIGPLLAEAREGLGMSDALAGLMTALPGLCFGAIGALAVALSRRIGMTAGIALGALAIVGGLLGRSVVGGAWTFLALTALALAGMALGNVLVPAWIKRHTPISVVAMTVHSTGLTVGGALGALLAAPLADRLDGGWRASLGVWGMVAALAILPWVVLAYRERRDAADHDAPLPPPNAKLSSSPTAVALTLLFGVQSMNAYVQMGWLPQIFRDAGINTVEAGASWPSSAGWASSAGWPCPPSSREFRT